MTVLPKNNFETIETNKLMKRYEQKKSRMVVILVAVILLDINKSRGLLECLETLLQSLQGQDLKVLIKIFGLRGKTRE